LLKAVATTKTGPTFLHSPQSEWQMVVVSAGERKRKQDFKTSLPNFAEPRRWKSDWFRDFQHKQLH
jgi:hypothetical protein